MVLILRKRALPSPQSWSRYQEGGLGGPYRRGGSGGPPRPVRCGTAPASPPLRSDRGGDLGGGLVRPVADPSLAEAGCLTAVTGADEDAVLTAFGAELDTRLTLQDWSQSMGPAVALVRLGDGMVVAEYNGLRGAPGRKSCARLPPADARPASFGTSTTSSC